ncbi:hypothetical protein GQ600_18553 [Phytophthora cactorum]|nr:hypothetical protein GQ600_18553 [Phytophthora cactorum]
MLTLDSISTMLMTYHDSKVDTGKVHPPVSADSEERGFAGIPLQRLNSLSEKIGVDVPKAASSTKYFNSLSAAAREKYHEGLNVLLKAYKKKKAREPRKSKVSLKIRQSEGCESVKPRTSNMWSRIS